MKLRILIMFTLTIFGFIVVILSSLKTMIYTESMIITIYGEDLMVTQIFNMFVLFIVIFLMLLTAEDFFIELIKKSNIEISNKTNEDEKPEEQMNG